MAWPLPYPSVERYHKECTTKGLRNYFRLTFCPAEHSHEKYLTAVRTSLNLDNPDQIVDPVFALLGNNAAAKGAGKITDLDCLQQATADRAFTNAKQAEDVDGQVAALIYRALERNTGKVGLASASCTIVEAVNPEIAAIQQHQDPASDNAASINKGIALELARQIAAVGGDPLQALDSGTFEPGYINDPTAAGNTCDDANDPEGCIFTQNLLVPDATEDEILAAASEGSSPNNNTSTGNNNAGDANSGGDTSKNGDSIHNGSSSGNSDHPDNDGSVASHDILEDSCHADRNGSGNLSASGMINATDSSAARGSDGGNGDNDGGSTDNTASAASGQNLQTFTGALGGATAPAVRASEKGFIVDGSDEFTKVETAVGRSCDIQHNQCADVANSQTGRNLGLTVGQCDQQNNDCHAAAHN